MKLIPSKANAAVASSTDRTQKGEVLVQVDLNRQNRITRSVARPAICICWLKNSIIAFNFFVRVEKKFSKIWKPKKVFWKILKTLKNLLSCAERNTTNVETSRLSRKVSTGHWILGGNVGGRSETEYTRWQLASRLHGLILTRGQMLEPWRRYVPVPLLFRKKSALKLLLH